MNAPVFQEDWFFDADREVLHDLAARTADLEGAVVEVGCWEGKSTITLANTVHPTNVHAVDTWAGSPGEVSADLASERDVFAQFLWNIDAGTAGNVVVHRQGWREFFADWSDPIRFIHIDACHSYEEVRANIEAALPLMVPGGIVAGDDIQHPPIQQALRDVFGNAFTHYPSKLWHWRRDG